MSIRIMPSMAESRASWLALGGLLLEPSVALAQEAASAEVSETTAPVIEEILVTATRRERALQDVSASISAVGMEDLQKSQIHTLEDLQFLVPSITIGQDFQVAKLFLRGVGVNTSTTGAQGSVPVHVDGAVIGRPEIQTVSLFDLERVEVLRGPQSSLYGRSAVGGSINFVTAKPTAEPGGYARTTVGRFDQLDVEGALSGPITDRVLGRLAFKTESRDGYGENPVTGSEVDDLNRRMARIHLDFLPSESFDFRLSGEWFRQEDASSVLKFIRETFPDVPSLRSPVRGGFATDPRDIAGEFDPVSEKETWAVTGELNWRINDQLSVRNITNFRDFEGSFTQDLGISAVIAGLIPDDIDNSLVPAGTTNTGNTLQRRDLASEQWSTELQLNFTASWVDAVFGFFYFDEEQTPTNTVGQTPDFGMEQNIGAFLNRPTFVGGPPGVGTPGPNLTLEQAHANCNTLDLMDSVDRDIPPPPKRVCIPSELNSEAWALFGQATIQLGELLPPLRNFALKLGGRYTEETIDSVNPAHIILGLGAGPIMTFTREGTFAERNFEEFTPEVGLEWRPSRNVLAYYNYAEGFKAGSPENNAGSSVIVDPETIDSHEVGIKTNLFEGRLAFNLAAFYFELQDLQVNRSFPDPNQGFRIVFENAAEMSAKGVDLDFQAHVTPRLRVNGALAYLDAEFDEFVSADPLDPRNNPSFEGFDPVEVDLSGNRTRNSPEWTANLHGEVDLIVGSLPYDGDLTLTATTSHRGKTFFTEFNDPVQSEDAFTFVDASLRYRSGDRRLSAELWGKNLGDRREKSATFDVATAEVIGANYHPPRTYGLSIGYRF